MAFLLFLLLAHNSMASDLEMVIVSVTLNQEAKGDLFVGMTDGDFLIRESDLKIIGFKDPKGTVVKIEGDDYLSLKSIIGVSFVFDESTLELKITVDPKLLQKRTIDLIAGRHDNVYYPRDNSVFLNYRLDYFAGDNFRFQSVEAPVEIGIKVGDFLLLNDSLYRKTLHNEDFVRLMSSVTYDRREDMQRFIFGDFFAYSGELGSGYNLSGVSLSKVYRINPYFIKNPTLSLSGLTATPSEVEIYLDGMLLRKERISPGGFDIKNLYYYGGERDVEIVIKDAYGHEQRITRPFYFTDVPLKKGLHEYSYNIGFLREDFGIKSNSYGPLVISAFHRYGVSDSFTVGLRGEGKKGLYNIGPEASYVIKKLGIITSSFAYSYNKDKERSGFAGSFDYNYQSNRFSARAFAKGYTKDYYNLWNYIATFPIEKVKYEAGIGVGYDIKHIGTVSLDYVKAKSWEGLDRKVLTAAYSKSLTKNSTVYAMFRDIREEKPSKEFFIGVNFYPWQNYSFSSRYSHENNKNLIALESQKTVPAGEGFGYRASVERVNSDRDVSNIDIFGQYNGKYGIYTGQYRGQSVRGYNRFDNYRFSAAGGVAYVSNTLGFSRPITDSFGVVKVGSVEGIRVSRNNQVIGKTDSSGKVFIPDMSSYLDNQISISDKDIPIDYRLSDTIRYVSPSLRSGSLILFEAVKFQAITGFLKIRTADNVVKPVEFGEISIKINGKEVTSPTGKDGEFYFENIKSGKYEASFEYGGKRCLFALTIPETTEMIIDLGEVTCEVDLGFSPILKTGGESNPVIKP